VGRTVTAKQQALAKARARRVAMDADRDARDRRVEEATAEVLVLLAERTRAEQEIGRTNRAVADALQLVLAEGVSVEAAANLVDLEVGEVRRLVRLVSETSERSSSAQPRVKPATPEVLVQTADVPTEVGRSAVDGRVGQAASAGS
jgi:hypothetical protein